MDRVGAELPDQRVAANYLPIDLWINLIARLDRAVWRQIRGSPICHSDIVMGIQEFRRVSYSPFMEKVISVKQQKVIRARPVDGLVITRVGPQIFRVSDDPDSRVLARKLLRDLNAVVGRRIVDD